MPCFQQASRPWPYSYSQNQAASSGAYKTEAECLEACKDGACCEGATCSIKPQCQCQGTGKVFKGVGTTCNPNPCTGKYCVFESYQTAPRHIADGIISPVCLDLTERQANGVDDVYAPAFWSGGRKLSSAKPLPRGCDKGCRCRNFCSGVVPCSLLLQYDLRWPDYYDYACKGMIPGGSASGQVVATSSSGGVSCGPRSNTEVPFDCGVYDYVSPDGNYFGLEGVGMHFAVSRNTSTSWSYYASGWAKSSSPVSTCNGVSVFSRAAFGIVQTPLYDSNIIDPVVYPPSPPVMTSAHAGPLCYVGLTATVWGYLRMVIGDGPQGGFGKIYKYFNMGTVSVVDASGEYDYF